MLLRFENYITGEEREFDPIEQEDEIREFVKQATTEGGESSVGFQDEKGNFSISNLNFGDLNAILDAYGYESYDNQLWEEYVNQTDDYVVAHLPEWLMGEYVSNVGYALSEFPFVELERISGENERDWGYGLSELFDQEFIEILEKHPTIDNAIDWEEVFYGYANEYNCYFETPSCVWLFPNQ